MITPGGPIETFLKLTGKSQADFERELGGWNPGAVALFLAEFHYQDAHDSTLVDIVEPVLQESAKERLRDTPVPAVNNESVDLLK